MPTTANYSFYKPTNGEKGTWGSLVSANFDDIDSLLFAGDHGDLAADGLFSLRGTASIALASSPANWNPTELQTNTIGWITADAARDVHGLVPGSGADGRIKMLWNVGAFDITLKDDSGTATAANRFRLPSGDVILSQDMGLMVCYDATVSRWRPIGGVSSGGGGGGGGAPDTAAYLVAATSGVSGLSAEVLAGATPGGELAGSGTSWAAPAITSIHGPEDLAHHDETHPFDDDAIHTNWTSEVPADIGITPAIGTTGDNYGNHVHQGAVDLVSLDDVEGPFGTTNSPQTILSYTLAANTAEARMRFRFSWAGTFTNTAGADRTITMTVLVGGTSFLALPLILDTANTNAPFSGEADLIFRTIGASAKIIAAGRMVGNATGGTDWVGASVVGTEATKNSTGSLAIALTSTNSASASTVSHSIQLASLTMMGVGA